MNEPSSDEPIGRAISVIRNRARLERLKTALPVQEMRITRSFASSSLDVDRLAAIVRRILSESVR